MLCVGKFQPLNMYYRFFRNKSDDYFYLYKKKSGKLAFKTSFSLHHIYLYLFGQVENIYVNGFYVVEKI